VGSGEEVTGKGGKSPAVVATQVVTADLDGTSLCKEGVVYCEAEGCRIK
jgi:hypothetical protein